MALGMERGTATQRWARLLTSRLAITLAPPDFWEMLRLTEPRSDNCPAFQGWVKRCTKMKSPEGTAGRFFRL
jgi:hypothetical protein